MFKKDFNIVIVGVGGQGLITLTRVLAEAALIESLDIKTSELHGLSQRGGSVETMIRFGKNIYSPLITQGKSDLVIALELQEALRACYYASKKSKTVFLINDFIKPIPGKEPKSSKSLLKEIDRFAAKIVSVPANEICQKKFNKEVLAGVYLIGLAVSQKLILLKKQSVLRAIKKIIPKKYLELNLKTFDFASASEAVK